MNVRFRAFILFMHLRDEIVIVIYEIYNSFSFGIFSEEFTYHLNKKNHKLINSMCTVWQNILWIFPTFDKQDNLKI